MQVESHRAGIDDVDACFVRSRRVDNGRTQGIAQQIINTAGAVKLNTRHAPELRRATQLVCQVELLAVIVDLVRGVLAQFRIEGGRVGRVVDLRSAGVVLECEPVPVQIAPTVHPRCGRSIGRLARRVGHARGLTDACVSTVVSREAGHGEPAERLAVTTGLECRAGFVVDLEVADVAVAAEDLDRGRGVDFADGIVNVTEGAGCGLLFCCVMADHEEKIDGSWRRVDDIPEPCFIDHGRGGNDLGDIRVAGEVEDDTKGKNTKAVFSGEVPVLVAQVSELIGGGV